MLKFVVVPLSLSGMPGMVRNDFEDKIEFKKGSVVTLGSNSIKKLSENDYTFTNDSNSIKKLC